MSDQPGWDPAQGGFQPPQPGPPPQQPGPYGQPSSEPQYLPPNQPYQPPPGQPYPQVPGQPYGGPSPRKRRKWPWVLGGIFLFFVLLIGGCTFFLVNLARGPIDGANDWIAMLDEGDFVGAQSSMCSAATTTPSTLEADFGAGIDDYNLNGFNSTNGATSVEGTVTIGGFTRAITLFVADQNDSWRVCNYLLL